MARHTSARRQPAESTGRVAATQKLRLLERRGAIVDLGARVRIGAVPEQKLDRFHIVGRGRVVQRGPVVDPPLLDDRAGRQQQLDELIAIGPGAGQRRDQRGKAGVVLVVRIRALLEQRADECKRTVIDRVLEDDLADARRTATVRKVRRIAEQALQRFEIAPLLRLVERRRVTCHVRALRRPPAW